MTDRRTVSREFDRIAGSRIARLDGGVPRWLALSSKSSLRLRFKMRRMGLEGDHIDNALELVDQAGLNDLLSSQPLGVRFSTVPVAARKPRVWDVTGKDV